LILSEFQIIYIGLAALLVGFTKTTVGGVGILAVLLTALAIPGKGSPGFLLPMLLMADVFAVVFYRRHCQWPVLLKLMPLTLVGVVVGYFLVGIIPADIFQKILGVIIFAILILEIAINKTDILRADGWGLTAIAGIIAGVATMVANAAGSIFAVYMLRMGLKKGEFVGTRSWYFLLLNIFKLPFSANLGLITVDTLKVNLMFFPLILAGAFAGYWFLGFINFDLFKWLVRIAALITSVKLLFF